MRFRTLSVAVTLAAASAAPFVGIPSAGAAEPAQIRVSNAYTYDAGASFDVTVCIDDTKITSLATTETTGPFSVEPGSHQVKVIGDGDALCSDKGEEYSWDFAEGETSTLLVVWDEEVGLAMIDRPDDLRCTPAGQGRVVIRHAATFYYDGPDTSVDVKSGTTTLATALSVLDQQITDGVPAGTLTDPEVYASGTTDLLLTTPDLPVAEGTVVVRTLFGGNDGDTGSYDNVIQVGVCNQTTTSTPAPTTTVVKTEAAAATAVKATPTYTG